MTAHTIETAIEIAAGTGAVWQILTDFSAYPDWNPFIRSIEGRPEKGSRLSVLIQPSGQRAMRFRPRIVVVENQRAFRWIGHLLVPGLFSGRHEFNLEAAGKVTRLIHRESFSGLLVPIFWNKLEQPTRAGFEAMNRAIKLRAEALSTKD